jgi:uncharacterized membrane protein
MRITELKREALLSLKGKWGVSVLLMLILALINILVPLVVEVIMSGGFSQWVEQDIAPDRGQMYSIQYCPLS